MSLALRLATLIGILVALIVFTAVFATFRVSQTSGPPICCVNTPPSGTAGH